MKTGLKLVLLTVILTAALGAIAYAKEEFFIKIAHTHGPGTDPEHYAHTPLQCFVKDIEQATNGRIKAKIYWNHALGKPEKVMNLLRSGMVEMQAFADGQAAPYYKDIQAIGIPYLFPNREVCYEVLDGPVIEKFNEKMGRECGIRPIAWGENGGYRHFSSNKLMKTAADLKGLKMRTMTHPVHMEMVRLLGMSPTPISYADLYTALQTGVVDGQENSISTVKMAKLDEVQKYIILDGHMYAPWVWFYSQKFLDKLPDDLRQILFREVRKAVALNREISQRNEKKDLEYLEKKGVTIIEPTPEAKAEIKKLTQGPIVAMLKKNYDPQLVDDLLEAVKEAEAKQAAGKL
ncbi:ABC transporter substrate-binding protein [Desulfosarcina ovata subsp. sediminis]|uniref:ABC transporter substrate-binding protein n=1 Tax=Desulfosarcina ovata subsp. sediminis TaxID=885957 RepID=A0A5K7ZY76_9BACT|nr:TRAP transporter substrate-binding protein [Desulfosarcina ovata]BBO85227.1 ABC transporter substrate-binding protein [Desulfosarcina ovata subsp. sediminis]